MKHLVSRLLSRLGSVHATVAARRELKRLATSENRAARAVSAALAGLLDGSVDADERGWAQRIEARRQTLRASADVVRIMDFGARKDVDLSREEMDRGRYIEKPLSQVAEVSAVGPEKGLLLLKLVRALRPATSLELGTCVGFSAAYQAAGLLLTNGGRLISIEGAESLASVARAGLGELGLANIATVVVGRFRDVLPQVLGQHAPVDFAFIDGHHDEKATVEYFETIAAAAPDALLVFDDISWSRGMRRAWETIAVTGRVRVAVDLSRVGLCVLGDNSEPKRSIVVEVFRDETPPQPGMRRRVA